MPKSAWRQMIVVSLCLLVALLAAYPTPLRAQAQASTGQIVGTVTDPTGSAIPGAKVTIKNMDTGLRRELTTNEAGQYRAVLLPTGRYDITVEASGFATGKRSDVTVNVGAVVEANFTMQVGAVTQTIEVTERALEVIRSESGTLVNMKSIDNLPINGRRFHDFALGNPSILVEPQRNQISIAGQKGINGNVTIDGADFNEPFFGGIRGGERSTQAFTVPQESIAEFQITKQGYSAEFGRSTGGIVNAVTRSGTNTLHGSAFYFLRHKSFGLTHGNCPTGRGFAPDVHGTNAFCQAAIPTQHQWGGSLGGKIVRDKTFFFTAVERQDRNQPRQVLFSSLLGIASTANVAEALSFYHSLEEPFQRTADATSWLAKIDHNFNPNHRLSVRYNMGRITELNAVTAGESLSPAVANALSNNGTEGDRTYGVAGQWTGVFSPRLVNELRLQWSRESRPRLANEPTGASVFSAAAGTYGTVNFLPTTLTDYRIQTAEALTWTHGSHTVRLGAEHNHVFVDQAFGFNQFGEFRFQLSSSSAANVNDILETLSVGGTTANRFDRANNIVRYRHQIGNLLVTYRNNQLAFFAEDSWRIRKNFTLNYGLRWEGQFNPTPEANNTSVLTDVRNAAFPIGISLDPTQLPNSLNQFMPRLGFAWDPFNKGKTVIRANGGIFYATTPLLVFAGPMNNFRVPPGDVSIELPLTGCSGGRNTVYQQLLAIGINLNTAQLGSLPVLTAEQVQSVAAACGLSVDPFRGAQLLTVDRDFKNARSLQWAVGVEHELARGLLVGGDFSYVNTVHLQRTHDVNLPFPTIRASDGRPVYGARPLSRFGQIWTREASSRSLYRAFSFRANYQRSRFLFNAYYTLSWNYSDDDNERTASFTEAQDQFRRISDYGFSRLDQRHSFVAFGVVDLPYGFHVGSTMRFTSARPINPVAGSDLNGDGDSATDRPFRAVGVSFPRNSFRNRSFSNLDLRVGKQFRITERAKLQFSVDFFNLFDFDNVQFAGGNLTYGSGIVPTGATAGQAAPIDARFKRLRTADGAYDTVNSAGAPFQMQLGLKFIF